MTENEKIYFEKLALTRQNFFNQIREAEKVGTVEGYWDSVVDKYSDQAHFIYEILQNADDAGARNAHFELYSDMLVFRHDGTKRFSVSDPDTYKSDRMSKKVGDINGITSIGGSGKFLDDAKIGKFGLGFKAVFQYTLTPSIYDDNAFFRIRNYIIPEIIEKDYPGRKKGETLFVFPFDRPDVSREFAFEDIREKLANLIFPNLFLNNLKKITYAVRSDRGIFRKETLKEIAFDDINAQLMKITKGGYGKTDTIWLFSRKDADGNRYSVGYFVDENGKLIVPDRQYTAFCFFPTLVTTGLYFLIHAPFLLTDNREGIMAGNEHNKRMITRLAELSADGLECLCRMGEKDGKRIIDDSILDIIPCQESAFSPENDRSKVSFMPFFTKIKRKLQNAKMLPARDSYTTLEKAMWSDTEDIANLISDEQLSELLGREAHFVFATKGRNSFLHNSNSGRYVDSIVFGHFDEDDIYRRITPAFIEGQDKKWLIQFYEYIVNGRNSATRITKIRKIPIFLDTEENAIAAYDKSNHETLFLPDKEETGYPTINEELYSHESVKKLLKELEIQKPEQEHRIYNKVIPQYINGKKESGSTLSDFKLFLNYYIECDDADKERDFFAAIENLCFIQAVTSDGQSSFIVSAEQAYMPTSELKTYFEGMDGILFVDVELYYGAVSGRERKYVDEFLQKVGVYVNARRYWDTYTQDDYPSVKELYGIRWPGYTFSKGAQRRWYDYRLEGGESAIHRITETKSLELSVILWKQLAALFERIRETQDDPIIGGVHKYPHWGDNYSSFEGLDTPLYRDTAWLFAKNGELVAPNGTLINELDFWYDTQTLGAGKLIDFLNLVRRDDSNLTDEQRKKIARAEITEGIPEDVLREIIEKYKRDREEQVRKEARIAEGIAEPPADTSIKENESVDGEEDDLFGALGMEEEERAASAPSTHKLSKTTTRVVKDILRKTNTKPSLHAQSEKPEEDNAEDIDQDDYTPAPVDYRKRIDKAIQKSAAEIDKISYFEELQAKAVEAEKYTYGWFKALLEMESINSGEANANSREISISFAKVELEKEGGRILVLKHPDRYIPQFMEDLADIPLVLHIGDQKKTVAIEVANIRSYTLRVKMKNSADIAGVDLSAVNAATIDAKSPAFLIEELRKQFGDLGYADDYNMQTNLCENIEFVFGPPGTGKTTHLARNVLVPLMRDNTYCKVLVLAPTNKAADVLAKRIMEVSESKEYEEWLVRFGTTFDEEIETSPVYRDKTFDIRTLNRTVTVTTIARFPYDFFMPQGVRVHLYGMHWDYIVIDEASMIPIANIVFPLYKKTPDKFIIAGDPFQIEPITSVDLWKNENIYTMVQLNSFTDPATVPYRYKVELLTTQYRSVPDIGQIFSRFVYGGILQHHRQSDSQRSLDLGDDLFIETLNIIKFPVSRYESIYRCKRLQHSSSYQVYSALFTFEYVCYLAKAIAGNYPGSLYKIGIIAPYRAQADLLDKLLASEQLPKETDVQVGTIHGFQGDECDIIFAVFNPPPAISASREMFLNKRNIINVSISRARDYLFIVMPDDNTENIENLRLVRKVERLIHETEAWNEFLSPDLEALMFGDDKYLENNAFSTSHQSVNVYGLPEKRYEVRTEDTAVDVQIHREVAAR